MEGGGKPKQKKSCKGDWKKIVQRRSKENNLVPRVSHLTTWDEPQVVRWETLGTRLWRKTSCRVKWGLNCTVGLINCTHLEWQLGSHFLLQLFNSLVLVASLFTWFSLQLTVTLPSVPGIQIVLSIKIKTAVLSRISPPIPLIPSPPHPPHKRKTLVLLPKKSPAEPVSMKKIISNSCLYM